MFDLDSFIADCLAANAGDEPHLAIRDVLARALDRPRELADALRPSHAGLTKLYVSDELTVLDVVWGPHMKLRPHDHRMWATIGIYAAGEDNTFFRRGSDGLVESGGKQLREGDMCLLGRDVIHAVTNPTDRYAGAIHIYGGNFFEEPRSEWDPDSLVEQPFDVAALLAQFEASNQAASS